jgi:hypothetical protein
MNIKSIKQDLLNRSQLSPQLKYSPDLAKKLSISQKTTREIIQAYFNAQPVEYTKELAELEQINSENIPSQGNAFIFVPSFNEDKNLESLASQYINQRDFSGRPLNKELYEVCFVVNYSACAGQLNKEYAKRFHDSIDTLLKIKQQHNNIHILAKAFGSNLGSLGRARKYGMDYCLFRLLKHPSGELDKIVIISNEGDTLSIPETYVVSYIKLFADKHPKFAQGKIDYPTKLTEQYAPINIFTACREAIHSGQGLANDQFPYFDGIMPVGRNFGVSPRVCAQVGGIDPIRRKDTDDDMNFGTDIHVRLGEQLKSICSISLITNPRREVTIVRDILAGRKQDSKESYENFHDNRALYDLSYADVLHMAENNISKEMPSRAMLCELTNQYFQWVLRSRYKAALCQIDGGMDIISDHRNHKISYWEKESTLQALFNRHLQTLDEKTRHSTEQRITDDALKWFNHFVVGMNVQYQCNYDSLNSVLK